MSIFEEYRAIEGIFTLEIYRYTYEKIFKKKKKKKKIKIVAFWQSMLHFIFRLSILDFPFLLTLS